MVISRLVPTLATVVLAGAAGALDSVAPVTTLAPQDGLLSPATVLQSDTNPTAALNVGADLLPKLYIYSDLSGWESFANNTAGTFTAGVAVVGISATDRGHWQYGSNNLGGWYDIDEADIGQLSDANALLLSAISNNEGSPQNANLQLRFVPNFNDGSGSTADFDATLTFRVWDGSDNGADGGTGSAANSDPFASQTYGGSPTGYSAETRTLTVHVQHVNQNPVSDAGGPVDVHVEKNGTRKIVLTASDPEGDDMIWSASATSYGTLSQSAPNGSEIEFTYVAGSSNGTDSVTLTIMDIFGGSTTQVVNFLVEDGVAPAIGTISPASPITVHTGQSITITVPGTDADDDSLSWSLGSLYYAGGSPSIEDSAVGSVDFTAADYATSGSFDVILSDDRGLKTTTTIAVNVTNAAPTIGTSTQTPVSATVGTPLVITFTSSDADLDQLSWSASSSFYHGSGDFDFSTTASSDGNTYTYTPTSVGQDSVTFYVDDGFGGTDTVTLTIDVQPSPNNAPSITSISVGSFAIVGQPFQAIVRTTDADTADLPTLSLVADPIDGANPSYRKLANGIWEVTWLPTQLSASDGSVLIDLTVNDHHGANNTGSSSFYVEWIDNPPTTVVTPVIQPCTADDVFYNAIAPGYAGGYSILGSFLNAHSIDTTRAFWWNGGGYSELPGSAVNDPVRNAAFLASTVPANLVFNPATLPAPFAIEVPANQWVFFGIPPLLENAYDQSPVTAHDLTSVFAFEDINGNWESIPNVYAYDPTIRDYTTTQTIATGSGYWIRNPNSSLRRLVRYEGAQGAARPSGAHVRGAAAAANEKPPAPPSSSSHKADSGGSGGCGAGGIAGLIAAAMAMFGLRRGRRS